MLYLKSLFWLTIIILAFVSCTQGESKENQQRSGKREKTDDAMMDISQAKDINIYLCQRWEHKGDHELPYLNEDDEEEVPMRAFCFFNDGTVVKDPRNKVSEGKWILVPASRMLQIKFDNGITEQYRINSISHKKMFLVKEGETVMEEYRADGLLHKNNEDDPFFLPNIRWMIRARAPESDAAIQQRVRSAVHFYYLFYMDAYKRKAKEIFFYGLPGSFKWYAGGIYIKKEKDLTKKWLSIFYNATAAHKGYELLDKMISRQYTWNEKEPNWIKKNAGVLKQMEEKI